MKTLIVPCAGKSNRFPNMKPKWMLTHPDGELMIEKAIKGLNTEIFDKIIITIVKPHAEKYEAKTILEQVFQNNSKIKICVLDDFTSSASETIYQTITKMDVKGAFVVKDSDNCVGCVLDKRPCNNIVGYNLKEHPNVSNVPGKSFLILNKQGIIQDIIEKEVVSNVICLGVYSFADTNDFLWAYNEMLNKKISGEMFISHIVSYLISNNRCVFDSTMAVSYDDWGTLVEWKEVQKKYRTYFVDVDGVLMKNCGKYGKKNWYNNRETIPENMNEIKNLQEQGAQIVITTSRTEEFRKDLEEILSKNGIKPYAILMGLNHAARVVINDFAPTNPYPSGIAVTIPRNSLIGDYLK